MPTVTLHTRNHERPAIEAGCYHGSALQLAAAEFRDIKSRLRSRAPIVAPGASGRRCGTTRRVSADFSFQFGVTFRNHNGTRLSAKPR